MSHNLLLHIYDIDKQQHNFLLNIFLKLAVKCGRFTTSLYITLSNYSAVVGTGGPQYPQVIRSKTYHGYAKPWIIPKTIYVISV